jgi:hypothetical protein
VGASSIDIADPTPSERAVRLVSMTSGARGGRGSAKPRAVTVRICSFLPALGSALNAVTASVTRPLTT